MDIPITRQKALRPTRVLFAVLCACAIGLMVKYLWSLSALSTSVARDQLVFDEVRRGQFTVSVRGSGILVPDRIQWLSASVEGVVAERVVKAGNVVKTGDLIVVLSNPQLVQTLAEASWELEALEAELTAARAVQESDMDDQKTNVMNAQLDYENSVLEYSARAELVKTGAISKLDYQRARLTMNQFQQRWVRAQAQLHSMEDTLHAQNAARSARVNKARKSLEIIQQQVDDLQVKATMDSIVLDMPLVPGQRVVMGDSIAKLAQQDLLIAEIQIPEIQIREVAVGQPVIIDTRNNKISGVVSRVDPAVVNGNVLVDVSLTSDLPDDARPDLSVDGEIMITDIQDTLYVGRPLFSQSRRQAMLFKLSEDGHSAERAEVMLGYGSVSQVQIVSGLQAGDKIIISDPTRFENHQRFSIR